MFIADDALYYAKRADQEQALAETATEEKSRYLHQTLAAEYRRRAEAALRGHPGEPNRSQIVIEIK